MSEILKKNRLKNAEIMLIKQTNKLASQLYTVKAWST